MLRLGKWRMLGGHPLLSGYGWVIGALLGGAIHWLLMCGAAVPVAQRA